MQHDIPRPLVASGPVCVRRALSRVRLSYVLGPWLVLALHAGLGCRDAQQGQARSAATAAPTPGPELKAAFVYAGAAEDGGWNSAHERARKAVEQRLGTKLQTTVISDKSEPAEIEAAIGELVKSGHTLIFAANVDFSTLTAKLAQSHPAVHFVQLSAQPSLANVGTYAVRSHEAAYLAGIIAGKMTKTNVLGIVGSMPAPQVILDINSFELGAQSINPAAKIKVAWVNKWYDPPKEAGEAQGLIDQRADVLFQTTQSAAVVQTAEKAGKLAIGWGSNMGKQGPHAHVASAVIDWTPLYAAAIDDALAKRWQPTQRWAGVKDGVVDLVSLDNQIPPDARKRVDEVRAGLKDGSFNPWTGPIVDQTGKPLLAAGQQADDAMLHAIHVYVRGIDTTQ